MRGKKKIMRGKRNQIKTRELFRRKKGTRERDGQTYT